ncbi:MAG: hypothetical protein ACLQVN_27170 [Bryobacteraceae bacterium]
MSSLTKIVTFFAVPLWSMSTPPAAAGAGPTSTPPDRYVLKHNAQGGDSDLLMPWNWVEPGFVPSGARPG